MGKSAMEIRRLAGAIGAAFWGAFRYQVLQEKGVDLGMAGA